MSPKQKAGPVVGSKSRFYAIDQAPTFGNKIIPNEKFELGTDDSEFQSQVGEPTRLTLARFRVLGYKANYYRRNSEQWNWALLISTSDIVLVELRSDELHPEVITVCMLDPEFMLTGAVRVSAIEPTRKCSTPILLSIPLRDDFGNGGVVKYVFSAVGVRECQK